MEILVKSRDWVENRTYSAKGKKNLMTEYNIISVIDPIYYPIFNENDDVLTLFFWDLERPMRGYSELFTEDMADEVLDYFDLKINNGKDWLIHCTAGISRSGAIASFLREQLNINYREFMDKNPRVNPNMLVLRTLRNKFNERVKTEV